MMKVAQRSVFMKHLSVWDYDSGNMSAYKSRLV